MFNLPPDCVVFFVSVVFLVAAAGECRRPSPPRPGASPWPSAAHQRQRPDATGVERRRDKPSQDKHAHHYSLSLTLALLLLPSDLCLLVSVTYLPQSPYGKAAADNVLTQRLGQHNCESWAANNIEVARLGESTAQLVKQPPTLRFCVMHTELITFHLNVTCKRTISTQAIFNISPAQSSRCVWQVFQA